MTTTDVYRDGKVHVVDEQCATCIFRPGNLMHLEPGRVADMVREANNNGCIPCHDTIHGAQPHEAICRGYYDAHRTHNPTLALADTLGVTVFIDPAEVSP